MRVQSQQLSRENTAALVGVSESFIKVSTPSQNNAAKDQDNTAKERYENAIARLKVAPDYDTIFMLASKISIDNSDDQKFEEGHLFYEGDEKQPIPGINDWNGGYRFGAWVKVLVDETIADFSKIKKFENCSVRRCANPSHFKVVMKTEMDRRNEQEALLNRATKRYAPSTFLNKKHLMKNTHSTARHAYLNEAPRQVRMDGTLNLDSWGNVPPQLMTRTARSLSRELCNSGKITYISEWQASEISDAIYEKERDNSVGHYKCSGCGYWHMTTHSYAYNPNVWHKAN